MAGLRLAISAGFLVCSLLVATPSSAVPAADAPVGVAGPVLPALDDSAAVPSPAGIAAALDPVLSDGSLGPSVGALVLDAATGAVLYSLEEDAPRPTASTDKLLTSLSVLNALGPEGRITTTVTWDPASTTLTIVGAGDPTLSSASGDGSSLTELADQVAKSVTATASITLQYDTSLFSGPALAPGWPEDYPATGTAAPVSALQVDRARVQGTEQREEDPALAAASMFAGMLTDRGLQVSTPHEGASVGTVVASTESVRIADMVEPMLADSDNDMAEMLAHLAGAEATGTGSFQSGAQATMSTLKELGIPTAGVELTDGSGLSETDVAPPATMAAVMSLVADDSAPSWVWPIVPGLAVGGFTGTLADRFAEPDTLPAAGVVRAKTGTLTGVSTLVGTVVDADGRLLLFALMADQAPDVFASRAGLDRAVAALVGCGCTS